MNKQLFVAIVSSIDLIVELNKIKVDEMSNLIVDCLEASVPVVLILEIWSLWSMTDDMVW